MIVYTTNERMYKMKLYNNEPKNSALNIRCNDAEKAMIDALCCTMRPKVSASKLLLYLCEEKAIEMGIISEEKNGIWSIERDD